TTGVGYEALAGFESLIGTDVRAAMEGVNASAYARVRFQVEDPSELQALTLRMKFDDGFIAYLNGVEIARENAPAPPAGASQAPRSRSDVDAIAFASYDVTSALTHLRAGENLLAIHGLNANATSSDFLVLPELRASRSPAAGGAPGGPGGPGRAVRLDATTTVKARALSNGEWSALAEGFYFLDIPLRVTELMYHPADPPAASPRQDWDFEVLEV